MTAHRVSISDITSYKASFRIKGISSGLRVPQVTHEDVSTFDNNLRRKTKGVSDGIDSEMLYVLLLFPKSLD